MLSLRVLLTTKGFVQRIGTLRSLAETEPNHLHVGIDAHCFFQTCSPNVTSFCRDRYGKI